MTAARPIHSRPDRPPADAGASHTLSILKHVETEHSARSFSLTLSRPLGFHVFVPPTPVPWAAPLHTINTCPWTNELFSAWASIPPLAVRPTPRDHLRAETVRRLLCERPDGRDRFVALGRH